MRYIIADLITSSSFELMIDIMLRDSTLESSNYIVRLIYQINYESKSGDIEETHTNYIDGNDQINLVIYSIKGVKSSLKLVRNFCMDACKGLKLSKCENCLKPISQLALFNNKTKKNHSFISLFYKVYQIGLKGQGKAFPIFFLFFYRLHSKYK